jgi:hypothetical protein
MTTHIPFINVMLSSPMRESQSGRINFPNLSANVWESMICFLDPATCRQMTVKDALQVAAAYDQYNFSAGAKCCDQVLVQLFRTLMSHGHMIRMRNLRI